MLVPLKWMNDYVKIDDIDIQKLADDLTMSGSKVEEVIENGKEISNVLTGRIEKIERHPDADKLLVCQVNMSDKILQIVTGANNINVGDIIPVAVHGATLPGGIKIKKGKLRGVESNGMMCSAVELGIADEEAVHGIYILPCDTPIGKDAKEVLGLNGATIDFEITPNRSDCLSVIGMAREASVTFNRELSVPGIKVVENNEKIEDYINIDIEAKDLCRRYSARVIKNIVIQDSPEWMKERLIEAGVRPINNIVDITNYVMLEYGQPLHAFDYDEINDKKIIVRRAYQNEKMMTLDGKERMLDDSMLVIADNKGALAVAGVMGGLYSEIKDTTKNVLLESANFNGTSIRITSKKLGFRTEASARFEKGIDPNITIAAVNRAAELIELLGAGEVVSGISDRYEDILKPWEIEVTVEKINSFLGTDISSEEMKGILEKLEIRVDGDQSLKLTIPTFRGDLELDVDIAEEIARIYGYDNIKSEMISGNTTQGGRNREQYIQDKTKEILIGTGLNEVITYSFINNEDFAKVNIDEDNKLRNAVKILNPLNEDMNLMRTTLIPSMLQVINRNYNRKIQKAAFFEIGKSYIQPDEIGTKLPIENNILCVGMYGGYDFFNLKCVIELLLDTLGIKKVEFIREALNKSFHPGKTANILINKKNIGILGEIHPDVLEKYELSESVYACELNFDEIIKNSILDKKFKALPKYPAIERDMALLIPKDTLVSQIEDIIKKQGHGLVESLKLFDVYEGKQIPEGKKSVAYSIVYRKEDRTLKDEEVNLVHGSIIKEIESKLGALLRL